MNYRKGDVIRFWRGSNQYVGVIRRKLRGFETVVVNVSGKVTDSRDPVLVVNDRGWHVPIKHIVNVEEPVLTEKEREALVLLDRITSGGRHRRSVAEIRSNGHEISGRTLHGLAERGFVTGAHTNVSSTHGPLVWAPTTEGKRVVRTL